MARTGRVNGNSSSRSMVDGTPYCNHVCSRRKVAMIKIRVQLSEKKGPRRQRHVALVHAR